MAEIAKKLQSIVNEWTSCADCNTQYPEWADIKHGIILCLQCAGIHRSLGTHVSQVRSLTLDVWQAEWVQNMQKSNTTFNSIFEYYVPNEYIKPTEFSSRELREKYIIAKYIGLDLNTADLSPLFHKDNNTDCLPPMYDKAHNNNNNNDSNDDSNDDNAEFTKNGTKTWTNHRKINTGGHQRKHSGMINNTGVLHINCLSALNLPKGNALNTKKSSYCSFDNGYQSVQTKIMKKNNAPEWNQSLILSINENECIKISVCNKKENDELCYQYLDIKQYLPDICINKQEFRDFEMIIAEKYKNHKQFKKQGKHILLNFDIEYDKMTQNVENNRTSFILDNTEISINQLQVIKNINQDQAVPEQESKGEEEEEESLSLSITPSSSSSRTRTRTNTSSSSSSTSTPVGRPGDTKDFFVSYDEDDEDSMHKIRLTKTFSRKDVEIMKLEMKMMEKETENVKELSDMERLINFNNDNVDYIDINGTIDILKRVLNIADTHTINILIETIRKLNEYIFFDADDINEINECNIDTLRDITNKLQHVNHILCNELMNIFLHVLDKYENKHYLIHNLEMYDDYNIIKHLLTSFTVDGDDIEYVFNQILKINESDAYKLYDIIQLIVEQINNNNINIKRLTVEILNKFSKDIKIQTCILQYSDEILRFLSLLDESAFINIVYNILCSNNTYFKINGIHYNALIKVMHNYENYDEEDEDIHIILGLTQIENIKQNKYILSENELFSIINESGYKDEHDDILNIVKSKQILNFLEKTQCALQIQTYFRHFYQRRNFGKIQAKHNEILNIEMKNKELSRENIGLTQEFNAKQNENRHQKEIINKQENKIQEFETIIKQYIEKENELKESNIDLQQEITEMKQNQIKQINEIQALKIQHLNDKQQFAIKMMTEINNLRNELKNIGKLQQKQQEKHVQQQTQQHSTTFFRLWS